MWRLSKLLLAIAVLLAGSEACARAQAAKSTRARLGSWRFNQGDLRGDAGQKPLVATNVLAVVSTNYDGTALRVSDTNGPAVLRYPEVEPGGRTNLDCSQGSIRLRYRPLWKSGAGPGHWVRLIEMGDFALSIDPAGQTVSLQSPGQNGGITTNVQGALGQYLGIGQPGGPRWLEITVTYSPAASELFFNGNKVASGPGVAAVPLPATRKNGFTVGSDATGNLQAQGLIDDLETFNFPVGLLERYAAMVTLSASVTGAPPVVRLNWQNLPNSPVSVQRRAVNETDWTTLATGFYGTEYTDASGGVKSGQRYEYSTRGRITVGVNEAPVESRGRVILLVDQTLAGPLATELSSLKNDMVGDGWTVIRHDVPRHDDTKPGKNAANIARIKSLVVTDYNADPTNTKALFILGHVAVPYSGATGPDGHGARPWCTDLYYGDTDGIWTDTTRTVPSAHPDWGWLSNSPGDGVFDQNTVPTNRAGIRRLELPPGRVDFAKLPLYYKPAGSFPRKSEEELLRQYLNKDHGYRHKQFDLGQRTIVVGGFPVVGASAGTLESYNQQMYFNALRNGSRWYGFDAEQFVEADLFLDREPSRWGFVSGFGTYGQIEVNHLMHTSIDLADPARQPPVGFYMFDGSMIGEWNTENGLLRAVLGTSRYGLASMWARSCLWHLEDLSLGEPLAAGLMATANDKGQFPEGAPIYLALLGDPTLRQEILAPVSKLTATRKGSQVTLKWAASAEPGASYDIFRMARGVDNSFVRLSQTPVTGVAFVDSAASPGAKVYQVRTLALVHTGSGSFTNVSQGIFVTAN